MKGELTSIPWIFLAVLIMSIGDSTFAYSSNLTAFQNTGWIWNLFFVASYFITSAGLFWHNRFFIFTIKKKQEYLKVGGDINFCKRPFVVLTQWSS